MVIVFLFYIVLFTTTKEGSLPHFHYQFGSYKLLGQGRLVLYCYYMPYKAVSLANAVGLKRCKFSVIESRL